MPTQVIADTSQALAVRPASEYPVAAPTALVVQQPGNLATLAGADAFFGFNRYSATGHLRPRVDGGPLQVSTGNPATDSVVNQLHA
jgi:hypothetical protein